MVITVPCDATPNGGCEHTCENNLDQPVCSCNEFFKLDKNNKNCTESKFLRHYLWACLSERVGFT